MMSIRKIVFCLLILCIPSFHALFASDFAIRGKDIAVLDASGIQIDTLLLEGIPGSLALSPDGSRLYVRLANENSIAVFDTKTLTLADWYSLDRVSGGRRLDPNAWSVDPVGGRLLFRDMEGKTVFADEYRDAARLAEAPAPAPAGLLTSPEFELSTLPGTKSRPSVDFDASGDFAATWTDLDGHDGSGEGVYIREFSADGTPQTSAEFRGNVNKNGDQGNSTLASASSGDYVVVWRDSSGLDGDGFGVFGRRFNNGGDPKDSNDAKIPNSTGGMQREPSVDMEPDGDFVAVWTGPSGGNKAVFVRRFNANGSPKNNEVVVDTSSNEYAPDVAVNSSGKFVVVWRDGADDLVRARVYASTGSPVGASFKVDAGANNQFAPSVGMDDSGNFTVAWQTNASGGILYRQFSSDGSPKGGTHSAGGSGDKDYAPSLSMNAAGKFCIAWRDDLLNVWARAFESNGDPVDSAFKPASGGHQLEPNCAIDEDSNFFVSWKYRPGDNGGSIRGRKFNTGAPPSLGVACTADPVEGLPPLAVDFTSQASGGSGSYTYSWDFDDGDTSTEQNPSHTYNAAGTYQAVVTAASGSDTATCKKTISVGTAPPSTVVISSLTVTAVNRNTPETIIAVKGSGFQDGATVSFNDPGVIVFVTNWVDSTKIKVRVNVLSTAYLGLHDVTVVNPDQSEGTGPELLKVQDHGGYPAPSVLAVDPGTVAAGTSPMLKITGLDFARDPEALNVDAGAGVTIDSVQWISSTEIHAQAGVTSSAACGVRDVVVSNGSASSQPCAGCLMVSSNDLSLGLVTPDTLHVGEGPVDVTIAGCGFGPGTTVKIKGTERISQTFVDSGTIILRLRVKPDTDPGAKKVIAKNSTTEIVKRKDLFQVKP